MLRPMIGVAAVATAVLITGCNVVVTGRGAQSGVPSGGPSSTAAAPDPSTAPSGTDPTASEEPAAAVFELGQTGTVTDGSGAPLADVTVSAAVLTTVPPDEFSDAASNGGFLAATVTIANIGGGTFPVAPLDFEVRYPDGTRVAYGAGSSGVFGFDDPLGILDLAAGETVSGVVAFDVDPAVAGQQVAYLDLNGQVLGTWQVP